ncbi:MAG: 23S rRNA (adenine(2503)-C(2))-methyltransferase RlmN [Nitrospirota bacterium]|nr:23S rRNA (adenine(2503)-C(2))-methyltransferase RlmN [Nitrospirota bacterium]
MKTNLKQLSEEELTGLVEKLGERPYRAKQIISWLYKKHALGFDDMTDLSIGLRDKLKKISYISNLRTLQQQASKDGTRKFLFELEDGSTIESVLIPNNKGEDQYTLCISSQVGCAMGCVFCVTGRMGLKRNLKAHEIADQVISVNRLIDQHRGKADHRRSITNIVYMGMGEPFNNFNEVLRSLEILMHLAGFAKRKITVSTSGIVPKITEFGQKAFGVNLAISLNASSDETRDMIMPVNKKYPLDKLMTACRQFRLAPNRRITFEYVMLGGINDTREDALRVIQLLKGIRGKVNLIPYNPAGACKHRKLPELKAPSDSAVLKFQEILHHARITTIIRKSKGADISAACGQLKAGYE